MTIKKARTILGRTAAGISDKQIQNEIDTATLLKQIFFDNLLRHKKETFTAST